MFKRVVVGCDGTPEARDAVVLGAVIARATGAGLSLVGVFPPTLFPVPGASDRRTLRAEAEHQLCAARDELAPDAIIHAAADLSVPRALRHYGERWHADLVVIGSDPHASGGRTAVGRRGRQLLGDAPFAVAIAERGLHARPFSLGSVGIGYDDGPEAAEALDLAAAIAAAADASLEVLTIVEDRVPTLTPEQWMVADGLTRAWESAREAELLRARSVVVPLGLPGEVNSVVGDPGQRLQHLSDHVDLIVVGSRRWGMLARLVMGSVAETLVTDAGCSVLIARRPSKLPTTQPGSERVVARVTG